MGAYSHLADSVGELRVSAVMAEAMPDGAVRPQGWTAIRLARVGRASRLPNQGTMYQSQQGQDHRSLWFRNAQTKPIESCSQAEHSPAPSARSERHRGPPSPSARHVQLAVRLHGHIQPGGKCFLLASSEADSDDVPLAPLRLMGRQAGDRTA